MLLNQHAAVCFHWFDKFWFPPNVKCNAMLNICAGNTFLLYFTGRARQAATPCGWHASQQPGESLGIRILQWQKAKKHNLFFVIFLYFCQGVHRRRRRPRRHRCLQHRPGHLHGRLCRGHTRPALKAIKSCLLRLRHAQIKTRLFLYNSFFRFYFSTSTFWTKKRRFPWLQ